MCVCVCPPTVSIKQPSRNLFDCCSQSFRLSVHTAHPLLSPLQMHLSCSFGGRGKKMVTFQKRKYTKTSTQKLSSYYLVRFSGIAVVSISQTSQFDVQLACYYSLRDLSCVKTKRMLWRHPSLSRLRPPHNQLWTSAMINSENFSPITWLACLCLYCSQAAAIAASGSRLILSIHPPPSNRNPPPTLHQPELWSDHFNDFICK